MCKVVIKMKKTEVELRNELKLAYQEAVDLMSSQEGLNINDPGYIGYNDLMDKWNQIIVRQCQIIDEIDSLQIETINSEHVILLYVDVVNNKVITLREANVYHYFTLDELMVIMDLDLKKISEILGFEADYNCLRISLEEVWVDIESERLISALEVDHES